MTDWVAAQDRFVGQRWLNLVPSCRNRSYLRFHRAAAGLLSHGNTSYRDPEADRHAGRRSFSVPAAVAGCSKVNQFAAGRWPLSRTSR